MPSDERKVEISPLSLQTGSMTYAVQDMMTGYEKIIEMLPNLADNYGKMIHDVDLMHKVSEEKALKMIDTYQHLADMSSELPELQSAAAENYRKNLYTTYSNAESANKENLDKQFHELDRVKGELLSMAQERIIIDLLTRDILHDTKKAAKRLEIDTIRETSNRLRSVAVSKPAVTATTRSKPLPTNIITPTTNTNTTSDLFTTIVIPEYNPSNKPKPGPSSSPSTESNKQQTTSTTHIQRVTARHVPADRVVVPSAVLIDPIHDDMEGVSVLKSDGLVHNPDKRYKKKVIKRNVFEPLAKTLIRKYSQTEQDLAAMRAQIDAHNKFDREKDRKIKKLTMEMQRQQDLRDGKLTEAVGRVVKEAVETFRESGRDVVEETTGHHMQLQPASEFDNAQFEEAIRRQAEEMHRQHKLLMEQQRHMQSLQQTQMTSHQTLQPVARYKVMNVSVPKTPLPVPTPRVVSVPPVPVEETPIEIPPTPPQATPAVAPPVEIAVAETQTVPVEPPPAPPQPVFNHVINVLPSNYVGCEPELIALLKDNSNMYQMNTAGNQALILKLIDEVSRRREATPPVVFEEQETEIISAPPSPAPPVEPEVVIREVEEEVQPPSPVPVPRNVYLSSLGEVTLGGDLLHGPYQVQPVQVPLQRVTFDDRVHSRVTIDDTAPQQGPRLRVVASSALMNQLREPEISPVVAPQPVVPVPTTPTVDGLSTLFQHLTNGVNDKEFISRAVQEGVQRGVKFALDSLPDKHIRVDTFRGSRPHSLPDQRKQPRDCSLYAHRPQSQKQRQSRQTAECLEDDHLSPTGLLKINSSRRLERRRDDDDYIGPPRRDPVHTARNDQTTTDDSILREIANSQRYTQSLMDQDLDGSFNDSLSIGPDDQAEEAWTTGDARQSHRDRDHRVTDSMDSAISSTAGMVSHKTLYRSQLTRDVLDLHHETQTERREERRKDNALRSEMETEKWYDSGEEEDEGKRRIPKVLGLDRHRREGGGRGPEEQFKPLVSRVLHQSATEDMLLADTIGGMFSSRAARVDGRRSDDEEEVPSSDEEVRADDKYYEQHPKTKKAVANTTRLLSIPLAANDKDDEKEQTPFLADLSATAAALRESTETQSSVENHLVEMARRQTRFSAAGVEDASRKVASDDLPRRNPGYRYNSRTGSDSDSSDDEVRSRAVALRQTATDLEGDALLVNPHRVVGAVEAKRRKDHPTSRIPQPTKSPRKYQSSLDSDSFGRSLDGSVGHSVDSRSEQSELSDMSSVGRYASRSAKTTPPRSDLLADQLMVDMLSRQRASTRNAYSQQGRFNRAGPLDRHSNHVGSYLPPAGRDDDSDVSGVSLSWASNSTASSVADLARTPSRLLTVKGLKAKAWR